MIELSGVSAHFGGVRALDGLDLKIGPGEILGLIGPNGSGKSTTLNLIAGLSKPTGGRILFGGQDIGRMPLHRRAGLGIARTFQHNRLFNQLTVWENLAAARSGGSLVSRWFSRTHRGDDGIAGALRSAGLADKSGELACNLSFAEGRRLELARALVNGPRLLLLDEPAAGLDLDEMEFLRNRITGLRRSGVTVLLVEHVMDLVMGVCDRIAVLDFGRRIAEGTPAEIRNSPVVRKAYLGGPAALGPAVLGKAAV
jgi:branched-chain amino acid transport system ATP-binding protein